MKTTIPHKIAIPVFVLFAMVSLAKGQSITSFQIPLAKGQSVPNNSLGIRFGYEEEFGGEISYQRRIFENNRLEIDLGYRNKEYTGTLLHMAKLTAIYQYVWNTPERYLLYLGIGGGYGHWFYSIKEKKYSDDGNYSYIAGQIGVEYNFEYIPFSISLDCKPEYINNWWRNTHFIADVALGARYRF